MSRAILFRNDEHNRARKSYWVCRSIEQSLHQVAREAGREVKGGFSLDAFCAPRKGTAYASTHSIVSIGLTAHERLADVIRTSLIYLDPPAGTERGIRGAAPEASRLAASGGAARSASKVVFLGNRARQAATYLPTGQARRHDLPPLDLSGLADREGDAPRLTIINHLADAGFARSITRRFLEGGDFFIECVGLEGERHNRVRYLADADVSEAAASVHVHVGAHPHETDRLRVCDSWQSNVPVLFFDMCEGGARPGTMDVRDEHDVLTCRSYDEAYNFLTLLLDTPALRRLLTANGRASAAPAAGAWREIAGSLAA